MILDTSNTHEVHYNTSSVNVLSKVQHFGRISFQIDLPGRFQSVFLTSKTSKPASQQPENPQLSKEAGGRGETFNIKRHEE